MGHGEEGEEGAAEHDFGDDDGEVEDGEGGNSAGGMATGEGQGGECAERGGDQSGGGCDDYAVARGAEDVLVLGELAVPKRGETGPSRGDGGAVEGEGDHEKDGAVEEEVRE